MFYVPFWASDDSIPLSYECKTKIDTYTRYKSINVEYCISTVSTIEIRILNYKNVADMVRPDLPLPGYRLRLTLKMARIPRSCDLQSASQVNSSLNTQDSIFPWSNKHNMIHLPRLRRYSSWEHYSLTICKIRGKILLIKSESSLRSLVTKDNRWKFRKYDILWTLTLMDLTVSMRMLHIKFQKSLVLIGIRSNLRYPEGTLLKKNS